MPQPMPRDGSYLGMRFVNTVCDDGTWIEDEAITYPKGGMTCRAFANCPDGKRRKVRCGIADTVFSIPGVTRIKGKRTEGYLRIQSNGETDRVEFIPYRNQ